MSILFQKWSICTYIYHIVYFSIYILVYRNSKKYSDTHHFLMEIFLQFHKKILCFRIKIFVNSYPIFAGCLEKKYRFVVYQKLTVEKLRLFFLSLILNTFQKAVRINANICMHNCCLSMPHA